MSIFFWLSILLLLIWASFAIFYMHNLIFTKLKFTEIKDPHIKQNHKPFELLHRGKWNILEIYLCAIFLLPIRLFLIFITWLIVGLVVLLLGTNENNHLSEYSRFRLWLVTLGNFIFCRLFLFYFGIYWISKEKLDISNYDSNYQPPSESPETTPPIVVSNHVSFLDLFYHACSNNFSFVCKKELLNAPIIGRAARLNQCIFVDRESREDKDQVQDCISQRGQFMKEGKRFPPILIFPEGTCTNGQYLLSFKKGAFKPLLPVKIVCLVYPIRNFSVSLGAIDDFYILLLSLCQLKNNLKIYEFNTFYPDCLQLSRNQEDAWSVYSNRIKEIMLKVIPNAKNSESGYRDLIEYTEIIKESVNGSENIKEKLNLVGDDPFDTI